MKGVLLVNLGSPESPSPADVRSFLDEFLMDKRVMDTPYLMRALLVKGVILNTRPKKSAAAYQKVWTDEGSPLIVISEKLKSALSLQLDLPVSLAMRYGSMSIERGIEELSLQGVSEILLIPLYPQFAMSSTETVVEKAREIRDKKFPGISINHLPAFYNDELYVNALTNSIGSVLKSVKFDHLLLSYHGLPERHIRKCDITQSHCKIDSSCCVTPSPAHEFCYRHQCFATSSSIVSSLGLDAATVTTSFQSSLGRDPWLAPNTVHVLEKLAADGVKNLAVATPSFVSDCLETLEEMEMENRQIFLEAGGESFHFVPCLNDNPDWVGALTSWVLAWEKSELKTHALI
jgi:ferrochelatase